MGFEYVYAYIENLHWFFLIGTCLLTALIVVLFVMRASNDIDIDDWTRIMTTVVPVWFISLLVCLSPGMEHIKRVRNETIKQKDKNNEEPIVMSHDSCNALGGLCKSTDAK